MFLRQVSQEKYLSSITFGRLISYGEYYQEERKTYLKIHCRKRLHRSENELCCSGEEMGREQLGGAENICP